MTVQDKRKVKDRSLKCRVFQQKEKTSKKGHKLLEFALTSKFRHVNSLQSKTVKIGDLHHALDKSLHVINHQETSSRLHELFSELADTIMRQNQGVSLCLQHVRVSN